MVKQRAQFGQVRRMLAASEPYPEGKPNPPTRGWRNKPLVFNMREFLLHGTFEDFRIGESKDAIRERVPEPESWAPYKDGEEADLWSFGPIDLIFNGDKLWYIFSDEPTGVHKFVSRYSSRTMRFDPWFLSEKQMSLVTVRGRLESMGIEVIPGPVPDILRPYRSDLLIPASGVAIMFEYCHGSYGWRKRGKSKALHDSHNPEDMWLTGVFLG